MKDQFRKGTEWEEMFEKEIMVFFEMCGEEDRKFWGIPDKQRKTDDYVRLLIIPVALGLRFPMVRILGEAEKRKREESVMERFGEMEKEEKLVVGWIEDFIAKIENPIYKETVESIWKEKKERIEKEGFSLSKLS